MNPTIQSYITALEEHIKNVQDETLIKTLTRNSYQRLLKAKEALKFMEEDLLTDTTHA